MEKTVQFFEWDLETQSLTCRILKRNVDPGQITYRYDVEIKRKC
jgi:hypothetical protein